MTHRTNESARKASFDDIYNAPDPGPYFRALRPLDYRIPHFAQPLIRRCISKLRPLRVTERVTVLDLCAGYGVNGALMKHDVGLDTLYRLFSVATPRSARADRAALAPCRRDGAAIRVIGQDVAGRALAYAREAGFLDAALHANLEAGDLSDAQADLIAETDLITITGGLSYIGATTLNRVFAALRSPPWVLYFPLRGIDTGAVTDALRSAGLREERWHQPLPQRRFANDRERRCTIGVVEAARDGLGPVSTTHQEAALCLARPACEAGQLPMATFAAGLAARLSRSEVDARDGATEKERLPGRMAA